MKKEKTKKIDIVKNGVLKKKLSKSESSGIKKPATLKAKSDDGKTTYIITPKGILLASLCEAFNLDIGTTKKLDAVVKKVDIFIEKMLTSLSNLATKGKNSELFGNDFSAFFSGMIDITNKLGKCKEILEEHGIDADEALNNGGEE